MERDMELVKRILLALEDRNDYREEFRMPSEDQTRLMYHLKIMEQAGLVEKTFHPAGDNLTWIYASITWDGQEFLESIKNDKVWNKIISKVKDEGANLPFAVIKSLAIKYTEQLYL